MVQGIFVELTVIIVFAVIISAILNFFRQPLIIGYILTGVLLSTFAFDIAGSHAAIETFAQIGVAFLLFMVGLNLNPRVIKEVGKVSLMTGLGQIIFTSAVGYVISLLLGYSLVTSGYIAIALTFSSTIIVLKLLSDRGELESLHGRISIGFLIVQDLVAMLVLMLISALGQESTSLWLLAVETLLKGLGLLGLLVVVSLYLLPKITTAMAKSQEYLFLFSIAWCLLLATIFDYFSFSIEMGALVAGVTLALSPYHFEIAAKMRPLRDFFVVLFFILLGSQIDFGSITFLPVAVFSLFVLIGNLLIMMIIMGSLGFTRRNSFFVSLTVTQISEFSLIVATLGFASGHIGSDIVSLLTMVGVVTIGVSSYLIMYMDSIYKYCAPYLKIFERKGKKVDQHSSKKSGFHIILFGYNRIGYDLLHSFRKIRKKFLVVDYNPETIAQLSQKGFDCRYGDVSDPDFLEDLELGSAKMYISTIPKFDVNLLLLHHVKDVNKKGIFICVSHSIAEAMELYREGATYVIMPHFLGGKHTSTLIAKHGLNLRNFLKERVAHIEHLQGRSGAGHSHPQYQKP